MYNYALNAVLEEQKMLWILIEATKEVKIWKIFSSP